MAAIRTTPVLRDGVDIPDEVARMFNDVYRILREQQQEINALSVPVPQAAQVETLKSAVEEERPNRRKSKQE